MASLQSLLLRQCCPGHPELPDFDLQLQPRVGQPLPCHAALLRARCPKLQITVPCTTVDEDPEVICALLQWVYSERVDMDTLENSATLPDRALRLAEQMGLRDTGALRERLHRNWRRRQRGCLAQDMAKGFAERSLDGPWFLCGEPGQDCRPVYGGFLPLLLKASSYFAAMLSGKWAETTQQPIKVGWPASEFERLLEFLHGGPDFIRDAQDLEKALHCADFFGIPALLLHTHHWIADHLDPQNAPLLWNFVDGEPRLRLKKSQEDLGIHEDLFMDADDACFDFHVREFLALSGPAPGTEEEDGWVPVHDLSPDLMQRLLRSGSLDVSTELLKAIVLRYAGAKWGKPSAKVHAKEMMPPKVLFNRDIRDQLLGRATISIRGVL